VDPAISINTIAYEGYDLTTALQEIAKIGAGHVELGYTRGFTEGLTEAHFSEASAIKINRLLSDLGLSSIALSAHIDLTTEDAVDELKRRIDFGNAFTYSKGEVDPGFDYKEALPYACYLHLKDMKKVDNGWDFAQIGEGIINYDSILRELVEDKKLLPLSIEHLFIYTATKNLIVQRKAQAPELDQIHMSLKASYDYVISFFGT